MGKQINMTSGRLGRKIINYALIIAATGILQQLFNAADIAVIGQLRGTNAQAAVGSNAPIIGLLVNLFVGISLGANVVIARFIGQKDEKSVSRAVHTSVIIAAVGGVFLVILGEIFADNIIDIMIDPDDVDPEVIELAAKYLKIYFLGMPVILLYNFEAAIFRSVGNTRTPLIALLISGGVNVALNLFFVMVVGMSSDGVATATVISNLISSLIMLISLMRTKSAIRLSVKKLKIDGKILAMILKIGVPSGIQSMIFSFANIIIQSSINSLGATVMAGSSSAFNIEIIAYYVMNSFGQACSTFVGQNYGAGKNSRCIKTLKLCLAQSAASTAAVCIIILIFARYMLSIFNPDPDVVDVGFTRLCYVFVMYAFSFAQEVLSGYLRGFGVSFIPAICSVVGICGVRITWVFTVFKADPSFGSLLRCYPLSVAVTACVVLAATLAVRPSKRYFIGKTQTD